MQVHHHFVILGVCLGLLLGFLGGAILLSVYASPADTSPDNGSLVADDLPDTDVVRVPVEEGVCYVTGGGNDDTSISCLKSANESAGGDG